MAKLEVNAGIFDHRRAVCLPMAIQKSMRGPECALAGVGSKKNDIDFENVNNIRVPMRQWKLRLEVKISV